jgi:hypothetical protein
MQHDCSKCKFNGGIVPGSGHHIKCDFPENFTKDSFTPLLTMAQVVRHHQSPFYKDSTDTPVFSAHGIKNGWCDWPMQFDPIWVKECLLYEPKVTKLIDDTSNPES